MKAKKSIFRVAPEHSLCSANYSSLLKEELDVRLKGGVEIRHLDLGLFHSR